MPPEQCPECGRFLSRSFVVQATPGPTPCPRCTAPVSFAPPTSVAGATGATADRVDDADDATAEPADASPGPARLDLTEVGADPATSGSIEDDGHPLDEWGDGAVAASDDPPADRGPALEPTVLVAGGLGALLGALLAGRRRRLLGVVLGTVLGLLTDRLRD